MRCGANNKFGLHIVRPLQRRRTGDGRKAVDLRPGSPRNNMHLDLRGLLGHWPSFGLRKLCNGWNRCIVSLYANNPVE